MPGVSGVGISFGADRIYDVLNALDLYPETANSVTKVMFANFGTEEAAASLAAIKRLRQAGISAEIYPDAVKMKKQMAYADAMDVPYVAIVGTEEMANGTVTLKNMTDGTQNTVSVDELMNLLATR